MTVTTLDTAQQLLRLGNAFCDAQALLTGVETELFTALHAGPASPGELRDRLGLHGRGLTDLLRLLVRLGVLTEHDGRFANSPAADRHLVAGRDGYVGGALLGAKNNLYPVWAGLTSTIRTGEPRSAGADFRRMLADPVAVRRYAAMMAGALEPLIPALLGCVDWSRREAVVDVGGCRGDLVSRLVHGHPGLTGRVFDLPELGPVFAERMRELGSTAGTGFVPGDFFADPLPPADVMIFGHILHNWDAARREQLMRAAAAAVRPGGVLLVYDRMLDDERSTADNLIASLIMALVTESGEEYPVGELAALARSAGFAAVEHRPLDDNDTLVICHR